MINCKRRNLFGVAVLCLWPDNEYCSFPPFAAEGHCRDAQDGLDALFGVWVWVLVYFGRCGLLCFLPDDLDCDFFFHFFVFFIKYVYLQRIKH